MEKNSLESTRFGSKDFWKVPSSLTATIPRRLAHRNVMGSNDSDAEQFSASRKHPVHIVDLPSIALNMTIGELLPDQVTNLHRHNYETIIYFMEGSGISVIESVEVEWQAGDAIYIPVWAWHQHKNLNSENSCKYIACENAALLQNIGGIAVREEGG
jgi:pyrroloquinoline-quinone synthase